MYDDIVSAVLVNSESITFAVIAFMLILLILILCVMGFRIFTNYYRITQNLSQDRYEERKLFLQTAEQQSRVVQMALDRNESLKTAITDLSKVVQGMLEHLSNLSTSQNDFITKVDKISNTVSSTDAVLSRIYNAHGYVILSLDRRVQFVSGVANKFFSGLVINQIFSWNEYNTLLYDGGVLPSSQYLIDEAIQTEQIQYNILSVFVFDKHERVYLAVKAEPYYVTRDNTRTLTAVVLYIRVIPNVRVYGQA